MDEQHNKEECWLPIPGFPGYDISNLGRVRSYWTQQGHKSYISKTPQRIRKNEVGMHGTQVIKLWRGKHNWHFKIHELIALAFNEKKIKMIAKDRDKKRKEIDIKLASLGLL